RQSVENLEAPQRYVATLANPLQTQRRLMHQLECQTRFDPRRGLLRPPAEQIPCTQAKMFWDQQPQAHHGVANLVSQALSDAALDAERIAVDVPDQLTGDLCRDLFGHHARAEFVEFFFEARTRRRSVPRYGC